MIDLYTSNTPNGHRVELMLEELGLSYKRHFLSLSMGDNHSPEFLKLNPSARIPVIVDHDGSEDGEPIVLNQSAAILLYLAEKMGRFLPQEKKAHAKALEWLFFDATDIATTRFDAFYLGLNHQAEATTVLRERLMSYYSIYDQHLTSNQFLAGDEYSIADIAAYPWAKSMDHPAMQKLNNIQRWMSEISRRPSVKKYFETNSGEK